MTRIIILLSLVVLGYINSNAQNKSKAIEVQASLNGRSCRSNSSQPCGINYPKQQKNNSNTNATLQVNKTGDLIMALKKAKFTLSKQLDITSKKTAKNKPIYVLKNTFVLDDDIRLALKLLKNIGEIPKGTYPINETKESIIITFKLR